MPTPEEFARQNIDALLARCGWLVQDYKKLDLSASKGIAIREVRLKKGRCDYLLLIDRKPVGIIEAKKEGVTLSSIQRLYAMLRSLFFWLNKRTPLGQITRGDRLRFVRVQRCVWIAPVRRPAIPANNVSLFIYALPRLRPAAL